MIIQNSLFSYLLLLFIVIYRESFVKTVSFSPYLSDLLLCLQCLEWCLTHIVTLKKFSLNE